MEPLCLDNPYLLLGQSLAPAKPDSAVAAWRRASAADGVSWVSLLQLANHHLCTPLWYVRLREDGLLELLPAELQAYLAGLHQANGERNQAFVQALAELLPELARRGIPCLLLKGAASLDDDLYGDPGARMLGDLDLLLPPAAAAEVQALLLGWGYREARRPLRRTPRAPDYEAHHLPRLLQPDTAVAIEIHLAVGRGQAGRTLPADLAWQDCRPAKRLSGAAMVPAPTVRLVHNAAHALAPMREYITSVIPLARLTEFAQLILAYGDEIDWDWWQRRGQVAGLDREFRVYRRLAAALMATPPPTEPPPVSERLALRRLAAGGGGAQWWPALHYRLAVAGWLWRNVCYRQGLRHWPARVGDFAAYAGASLGRKLQRETPLNDGADQPLKDF